MEGTQAEDMNGNEATTQLDFETVNWRRFYGQNGHLNGSAVVHDSVEVVPGPKKVLYSTALDHACTGPFPDYIN